MSSHLFINSSPKIAQNERVDTRHDQSRSVDLPFAVTRGRKVNTRFRKRWREHTSERRHRRKTMAVFETEICEFRWDCPESSMVESR